MSEALTPLESEVADLRRRLVAVEERVRLDANAHAFLRGDLRVREGDYCVIDGFPTRVTSISSGGKWTYFNGHNVIEPFRVPPSDDVQRLYTVAEVAEIVAKARQEAPGGSSCEVGDHAINQAIDRMIDSDRTSPAVDLLGKVRTLCAEFPIGDLRTAIEVHRANCHQPSCPVLAAMEDYSRTREASP